MGRDEYPVTITSSLDILIRTEGGILGIQQSTYDNHGGRVGRQQKGRMGHTFSQQRQGFTQVGTEENVTLFPGKGSTALNATCYNFRNPGHISYNFSEVGRTVTSSLQGIRSFAQT